MRTILVLAALCPSALDQLQRLAQHLGGAHVGRAAGTARTAGTAGSGESGSGTWQ